MKRPNKLIRKMKKNKNWIFAIAEIGLVTGSIIFTVKGSKLYMDDYSDEEPVTRAVKSYLPAVICFTGFVTLRVFDCIYINRVQETYAKAIMALQSAVNITEEDILRQKELEKKSDLPSDHFNENTRYFKCFFDRDELPDMAEYAIQMTPGQDDIFYIPSLGIMFVSSIYDVKRVEQEAKFVIMTSGQDLYVDDLLAMLGVKEQSFCADWYFEVNVNEDDFELILTPAMTTDSDPFLFYCINFSKPMYDVNVPVDYRDDYKVL